MLQRTWIDCQDDKDFIVHYENNSYYRTFL